jgi:hypothetical protein
MSNSMITEPKTPGVRTRIEGHVCVISLDNTSKKNAITPTLMSQLSEHLTAFDEEDDLWVAVMDPDTSISSKPIDGRRCLPGSLQTADAVLRDPPRVASAEIYRHEHCTRFVLDF